MLPIVLIPIAEIVSSIAGAVVVHKLLPKKINLDVEFD
jgi:hypothetical protein